MFGDIAFELIKKFQVYDDTLPPFNHKVFREAVEEIRNLIQDNCTELQRHLRSDELMYLTAVSLRDAAVDRNKRCLAAYIYNRILCLQKLRWKLGGTLPNNIQQCLTSNESEWFRKYNNNLVKYMESIKKRIRLDLTQNRKPPKSVCIDVRCLTDFGTFMLDSGEVIHLKRNCVYLLPRCECEMLLNKGIMEMV